MWVDFSAVLTIDEAARRIEDAYEDSRAHGDAERPAARAGGERAPAARAARARAAARRARPELDHGGRAAPAARDPGRGRAPHRPPRARHLRRVPGRPQRSRPRRPAALPHPAPRRARHLCVRGLRAVDAHGAVRRSRAPAVRAGEAAGAAADRPRAAGGLDRAALRARPVAPPGRAGRRSPASVPGIRSARCCSPGSCGS